MLIYTSRESKASCWHSSFPSPSTTALLSLVILEVHMPFPTPVLSSTLLMTSLRLLSCWLYNGNRFDVSNHRPILTRLGHTFSAQLRTTFYAQFFKGGEAMHITWKTQQLRTVNYVEFLKTSHCRQKHWKHL
ncbi:hypothetical protein MtrunA17_Chr7g0257231 [Medicago truncatula]|uniref:Uncharacterized protein n=1 Tax=Medicago truncatula TaxID=3880 RepID=A0A396H3G4_MEDTR|nr:hypothetical protein MtrunA17_Chr7g0257231 [Medicago truncatula]